MPSLYIVIAGFVLAFAVGIAQEVRLAGMRIAVHHAQAAQAQAQGELSDYQIAAAAEIARRLRENEAIEARSKQEIADARQDYARRLGAIDARGLRQQQAPAAGGRRALPAPAAAGGRAVDGAPDGGRLPLCVGADRGPALDALLREADINTAKLIACQGSRQ